MSDFTLPASYGPYIDTHVPGVLDKYNTDSGTLAGEIDQWDEGVSLAIHSAHAYATSFFQELMDDVNQGVSELRADIAEVKRLRDKRWQDASNSFNWNQENGPSFSLESLGNAIEGVWNNDKAREDHADAAVREGGYDAEIARLKAIKTDLDRTIRGKVQSAIDKANEVKDLANEMPQQVLRLAELNAGYVWSAFRMAAYKQGLTEFRDTSGATDLVHKLNLDTIQSDLSRVLVKIVDGEIVLANPGEAGAMSMSDAADVLHQESLNPSTDLEANIRVSEENRIPDRTNVGVAPVASPIADVPTPTYSEGGAGLIEHSYDGVDDEIFNEYKDYAAAHPNSTQDFGAYMATRHSDGALSPELAASIDAYVSRQLEYYPNGGSSATSYFNVWSALLIS